MLRSLKNQKNNIKFFRKKKINQVHNNFIILQFRKIIENRNK